MSSKKQLRRARQEKEKVEKARSKFNPSTVFLVSVVMAVLLLGGVAYVFRADHGEPPFPGAVWSNLHQHWH